MIKCEYCGKEYYPDKYDSKTKCPQCGYKPWIDE